MDHFSIHVKNEYSLVLNKVQVKEFCHNYNFLKNIFLWIKEVEDPCPVKQVP